MTPTESTASCNDVRIMTHEEFAAKHPHPLSPVYVTIDRHSGPSSIDRKRPPSIDNLQHLSIDEHLLHTSADAKDRCCTSQCTQAQTQTFR
ncbi:hypothetical protein F2Q69_00035730 [Brassica cretica]|uniref:Uncharacterized protein n=1 Tax=Brassica cretica TaxID=69181 RepID=A0A8S9SRZ9_BRACR|nr:hypothetical protein F2Q69_00035730 [Brassica cretica]